MKKPAGRLLFSLVKILVAVALIYFIGKRFNQHDVFGDNGEHLRLLMDSMFHPLFISLMFLGMFVNWSLETWKWNHLLQPVEKIGFVRAFRSVLTGVTVSFFTPNRIGEFAGRIMHLDEGYRVKGAMAAFVGNSAQLLITIQAGLLALAWLLPHFYPVASVTGLIVAVLTISLSMTMLLAWFRLGELGSWLERFAWLHKYREYTAVFSSYTSNRLIAVYSISALRYAVFASQQVFVLRQLGHEQSYLYLLGLCALAYFILAIIPTFAWGELGIRISVNAWVFSRVTDNLSDIVVLTFVMWFVNLVIPAVLGSLSLLFIRYRSKSDWEGSASQSES